MDECSIRTQSGSCPCEPRADHAWHCVDPLDMARCARLRPPAPQLALRGISAGDNFEGTIEDPELLTEVSGEGGMGREGVWEGRGGKTVKNE
jgi:hypothetical protein